jgi:hypothetical protein
MSLLSKIISSFFPSKVTPAFVEEPWFLENHELQLDVLRLCQTGMACAFYTPISNCLMFKLHVVGCMQRYVDVEYTMDDPAYRMKFAEYLATSISGGEYLLTRGWFCNNTRLHVKVFLIELNGMSSLINAIHGDFEEHIDSIINGIEEANAEYIEYMNSVCVSHQL